MQESELILLLSTLDLRSVCRHPEAFFDGAVAPVVQRRDRSGNFCRIQPSSFRKLQMDKMSFLHGEKAIFG